MGLGDLSIDVFLEVSPKNSYTLYLINYFVYGLRLWYTSLNIQEQLPKTYFPTSWRSDQYETWTGLCFNCFVKKRISSKHVFRILLLPGAEAPGVSSPSILKADLFFKILGKQQHIHIFQNQHYQFVQLTVI